MLVACGAAEAPLESRFVAVHNAMTAMGLSQSGIIHEGGLATGEEARFAWKLEEGRCYTAVALGGSGVRNVDLVVMNGVGEELSRDTTSDRQAATQVCVERDGEHEIVVSMQEGQGTFLLSLWSNQAGTGRAFVSREVKGTCTSPIPLELGRPIAGDTRQGLSAMQGSCVQGAAPEQVYRLELRKPTQLSATLQANFDGNLYLLRSCGDIESELACNDDEEPGQTARSQLDATLPPGVYFLVVDGYANEAGEYQFIVSTTELAELRTVCDDAVELVPGHVVTSTTRGSGDYFQASCAGGARAPDRVHEVDVTSRSRLRIRQQSDFDAALYLRRTCDDPASELACNDDFRNPQHAIVTKVVDAGRYFVVTDGFSGQGPVGQGKYVLEVELGSDLGDGVPGDSCEAPLPLEAAASVELDTFSARDDTKGSCGGAAGADLLYRIDAPGRSRIRARILGSEFAGAMYLRTRCDGLDSEVACVAIPSSSPRDAVGTLDVAVPKGTYHLVIDGENEDAFGRATLELMVDDTAALDRRCQGAPLLRSGETVRGETTSERDQFQASCGEGTESPDAVYRLRVPRRSRVVVHLKSEHDAVLHLRRSCSDPSTELACNDDYGDNRNARIDMILDAGTYFVIADGFRSENVGPFAIETQITPL